MKILILCVCFCSALFSNPFSEFDASQNRFSRREIEEKLGYYLQRDGHVGCFYSLTNEAFTLFDAPETQKERNVEFCLRLSMEGGRPMAKKIQKGLAGVKIALDPGHLGGPYARLEERYIDIPSPHGEEAIRFDEGTLSFLTALHLKGLLEKEGAIVMMTRNRIGQGVYGEDFFDWLRKSPSLWTGGGR